MNGRSQTSSADARYKFTGKERDAEINYDYFGARYYDYRIGRWLQVDPMADKYHGWSPYNYTLGNPVNFIDPDGKEPWDLGMPMTFARSWQELKIRTYAFLGMAAATAAVYYVPAAISVVGGWWLRNPIRANEIISGVMGGLSNSPEGSFLKASTVKGLNVGELQRLNIGKEVQLGLKSAVEGSKQLAEGGATITGKLVKNGGKVIELSKTANGEYQVIVKTMVNGKVVNTVTTNGTADKLGIKNIEKLVEKGKPFSSHFLQERR